MKRASRLAVAVVVLLPAASLVAADGDASDRRLRVRVTAPGVLDGRIVGEIVAANDETITVEDRRDGRVHVIPADAVTRVEMRRKTGAKGRAVRMGALVGLGVGAILGYAAGDDCGAPDAPELVCFPRGGTALALGLVGSLVGAGVGAVAVPSERWQLVEYRSLTAGITTPSPRRRAVGVFVAASF